MFGGICGCHILGAATGLLTNTRWHTGQAPTTQNYRTWEASGAKVEMPLVQSNATGKRQIQGLSPSQGLQVAINYCALCSLRCP